MEDLKKTIEDRIKDLNIDKNKSSIENGQIWARKEELKWILNVINKSFK